MRTENQTPGPWRLMYVQNKKGETRLAVGRHVGGRRIEYVHSASGRVSTFCTEKGARFALKAAIAKESETAA